MPDEAIREGQLLIGPLFGPLFGEPIQVETVRLTGAATWSPGLVVYDYLLKAPRVRFLLADDAGARKTIMAGLLAT